MLLPRHIANLTFCCVAVVVLMPLCAMAQKPELEASIESRTFFDNLEYKSPHRISQTMDGTWITPLIGVTWGDGHALRIGYSARNEWGDDKGLQDETLTLYYQYDKDKLRFTAGAFSRDELRGDFPTALISDSIRYYHPNMEGFSIQYGTYNNYIEAFLDWTGYRTEEVREQFMAGMSGQVQRGALLAGFQGYYYHCARRWGAPVDEHVHDYGVANFFAGADLSGKVALDSLRLQAGILTDCERDRQFMNKWHVNPGFFFEGTAAWRNLYLKETLYLGKGQQVFGTEGDGLWYCADSFYRSKHYSRTDFLFRFLHDSHMNAHIGLAAHFDEGGFSWSQRLLLTIRLGNMKHRR